VNFTQLVVQSLTAAFSIRALRLLLFQTLRTFGSLTFRTLELIVIPE
jgi:hypothetical protein